MVNSKQEEEKQFNFLDSEKRKILCKMQFAFASDKMEKMLSGKN
jgi:hypothetical protein